MTQNPKPEYDRAGIVAAIAELDAADLAELELELAAAWPAPIASRRAPSDDGVSVAASGSPARFSNRRRR